MRSAMYAACATTVVAFEPVCGGRVKLTPEQLAGDHDDLIAEARIGCSQKCGCLEAIAWIEGDEVVAQCRADPGELALGHRKAPEMGREP
jgi:hypothetical protein